MGRSPAGTTHTPPPMLRAWSTQTLLPTISAAVDGHSPKLPAAPLSAVCSTPEKGSTCATLLYCPSTEEHHNLPNSPHPPAPFHSVLRLVQCRLFSSAAPCAVAARCDAHVMRPVRLSHGISSTFVVCARDASTMHGGTQRVSWRSALHCTNRPPVVAGACVHRGWAVFVLGGAKAGVLAALLRPVGG